jgi:photosystem II stability/assembly factor-like uncharacterized protein
VPSPALPSSISITAPERADWQSTVSFDSSVATAAARWSYDWRFGDGGSSTDVRPQHIYASAGEYTVTLTIADGQGVSVAATKKLTVQPWANLRSAACSQPGVGGWCRIGVDTPAASVGAVYMIDATQAWASTAFGNMWRTRDAGKTWQPVSSGPNGVTGLYFQDAMNGWLATNPEGLESSDTVVWRTTDGGASFSPTLPELPGVGAGYKVRVLGGNNLIAESQVAGPTFGSVDGGATWHANPATSYGASSWSINLPILPLAQRSGRLWRLNGNTLEASDDAGATARAVSVLPSACAASANTYIALSLSPSARLISVQSSDHLLSGAYRTRACFSADGGVSWTEAAPGQVQPSDAPLYSDTAWFIGETGGFIRDGQGLLWSNPLGSPWQRIYLNREFDAVSRIGIVDSTHLWAELRAGGLSPVLGSTGPETFFTADNVSWIGAVPTSPDLTRSYQYRIQSTIGDASNYVFDAQRGLQLWKGELYLTADNGASRTPVMLAGAEPVPVGSTGAGTFLNVKQGFVVSGEQTLLQSNDGGKSWTASATIPAGWVYNVWAGPEQSLWVSGFFTDQGAGENRLLRSIDAGKTWTSAFKGTVLSVQFLSSSQGWLHTGTQVFKSADFGQTWQAAGLLPSEHMQMLDASHGVAGYARFGGSASPSIPCLQTTEDGGATWSACAVPQVTAGTGLFNVAAAAGSFWLFNSSGLHRSNDFGKTWAPIALPGSTIRLAGLNQMAFADAQQGWLVSNMGGVWATGDGGTTWALQSSGTSANLKRLSVVDARAVWAFGANTIIGTATGGQ